MSIEYNKEGSRASATTGYKDEIVGGLKELSGKIFGNERLQVEGRQQKLMGEHEVEVARGKDSGLASTTTIHMAPTSTQTRTTTTETEIKDPLTQPLHQPFVEQSHIVEQPIPEAPLPLPTQEQGFARTEHPFLGEGKNLSKTAGYKDEIFGGMKEMTGKMGNERLRLEGQQQKLQGELQVEQANLAKERHDLFTKNKKSLEGKFPDKHHQEIMQGTQGTVFLHQGGSDQPSMMGHQKEFEHQPFLGQSQSIPEAPLPLPTQQQGFAQTERPFLGEGKDLSKTGYKDQMVGGMKEMAGTISSEQMRREGQQQKLQGEQEVEQAKLASQRHDLFTKNKKSLEAKFPDKHHQEILHGTAVNREFEQQPFMGHQKEFDNQPFLTQSQPLSEVPLPLPTQYTRTEDLDGKNASKTTGFKDEVVGGMKEMAGKIGSEQMRLEGQQQKLHGEQEVEQAKLASQRHDLFTKNKKSLEAKFPDKHHQEILHGTAVNREFEQQPFMGHQDQAFLAQSQQPVFSEFQSGRTDDLGRQNVSKTTGYKDEIVGGMKEIAGKMGSEQMRLQGEQQKLQGEQEIEQAKLAKERHDSFTKNKKNLEAQFPDKHHQEVLQGIALNQPFVGHQREFEPEPVLKPIHDEPLPLSTHQQGFVDQKFNQPLLGESHQSIPEAPFPLPTQQQGFAQTEHPFLNEGKDLSKTTGYKDQMVGGMKEMTGKLGSEQMRREGQQQKLQGEQEVEQAKLASQRHDLFTKNKKSLEGKFPDKHHQEILQGTAPIGGSLIQGTAPIGESGIHSTAPIGESGIPSTAPREGISSTSTLPAESLSSQHIGRTEHPLDEGKNASKMSGYKDELVGGMKQIVGKITSEKMRVRGEQQKHQGAKEVEQAKLVKGRHSRFLEGKKKLEGQFPDKHHQQLVQGTHQDSDLMGTSGTHLGSSVPAVPVISAPIVTQTTTTVTQTTGVLGVSPRSGQLGVSPRSNQLNVSPRSNVLNTSPRHCVQQPLERSPRHMQQV